MVTVYDFPWYLLGTAVAFFVLLILYSLTEFWLQKRKSKTILEQLNGKHVLITGGSQGIGKSMAELCFKNGANVTLFARDPIKLNDTKSELILNRVNKKQQLNCFSVDVTSKESVDKRMRFMAQNLDPIDILINCAGTSIPETVEQTSIGTFEKMMNVNYFGSVYTTKNVITQMKERGSGHIVFVSSIAGIFGMYGFSAYSAAKFALIGLAQSLHMEMKQAGVSVTVVLPPDTETPGFEQEQTTKPIETKLISESGGLCQPITVAEQALKDVLLNNFTSTVGIENHLVRLAGSGCFPIQSIGQLVLETLLIAPCKLCFGLFLINCYRILHQCKNNRADKNKDN